MKAARICYRFVRTHMDWVPHLYGRNMSQPIGRPQPVLSEGQRLVIEALQIRLSSDGVHLWLTGVTALAAHFAAGDRTVAEAPWVGGPLDTEPRAATVQVSASTPEELAAVTGALAALEAERPDGVAQVDLPDAQHVQNFDSAGHLTIRIATEAQYQRRPGALAASSTRLQIVGRDHADFPPSLDQLVLVQGGFFAVPAAHAARIVNQNSAAFQRTIDAATDPSGSLLGWQVVDLGSHPNPPDAANAVRRWINDGRPSGGGLAK